MTVSKAIIEWLKEFNPEEYQKMHNISTDLMQHDVDYVLVKEPVKNVKKFISGTQVHGALSVPGKAECIHQYGCGG